jgi:UDP-N-acetylmuramoyl-tripeptide--D-alanyl-D-alanine ligase
MFTITELIRAAGGTIVHAGTRSNVRALSIDSRAIRRDDAFLAIPGKNFDGHDFIPQVIRKGVRCVIVQKGHRVTRPGPATVIEVPDTVRALGSIAQFHRRRFDIPVIAITGSNGKTTTKDMLAWILSGKRTTLKNEGTRNNHIGVPNTLLRLDASHRCAVIELGTNHFGEIAYLSGICEPTMAIITNIGPSHLEFFKDLPGVLKEKSSVFDSLREPRIAVLNTDDPLLRKEASRRQDRRGADQRTAPFVVGFGIETACDFQARDIRRDGCGFTFVMHTGRALRLASLGSGNIYNALAAIAACRMLGVGYSTIASRLKSFVFPGGRLTIRSVGESCFIDDTYNANPLSMRQAMDALRHADRAGRRILVMGDMLELGAGSIGFHRDAGKAAAASCDIFITVGKHALAAASAAARNGFDTANLFTCATAAQAKDILFHTVAVRKDDIVLLKGSRGMKLEQIIEQV